MNYDEIYDILIDRGKIRILECYQEEHHIIPKCVGGTNDLKNLVNLTPEEHYVAHLLLIKMNRYKGHENYGGLIYAANFLTTKNLALGEKRNNKLYGWLKRKMAKETSKRISGVNHHMYGKEHSQETRRKISEARKGQPGNWLGKKHTPESIERMKEVQSIRHPPIKEVKIKISKTMSSKRWITNDIVDIRIDGSEDLPEGFRYGRGSKEFKKKIGDFHRGKIETERTRKKKSEAHKGKPSNRWKNRQKETQAN